MASMALPRILSGPLRAVLRPRRLLAMTAASAALLGCHGAAGLSGRTLPNVALPTAGGQQLWADVAWDDGWRVQEHVWTGHGRLLDGGDVRRAWGGVDACKDALAQRAPEDAAPPEGPIVVVLHGLWRTRGAMAPIAAALTAQGFEVLDVTYPSTRRGISEHAAQVAELLDGLPGEGREVSFVTHSLGALVTRALLARDGDAWRERHRLGRAVFIAAPHQGATMADVGAGIPGALAIYGEPSREIANGAARRLPAPPLPFLNIAAARGTPGGWNPLIPGDDDGVVGVAETHLHGETKHLTVEGVHTLVMSQEEVLDAAALFLRTETR